MDTRFFFTVFASFFLALASTQCANAITFHYGSFAGPASTTSPPRTAYDFTNLPFSFSTSPLAYQWGYVIDGNPTPQSASSVKDYVEDWTGLNLSDAVAEVDDLPDGSTGVSSSVLAEVFAL